MKSMTGFGRAVVEWQGSQLAVQVNSVNRKTLDVTVSLPRDWAVLEPDLLVLIKEHALRGKIYLRAELAGEAGAAVARWDDAEVAASLANLRRLAVSQDVPFTLSPELLWQVAAAHRQSGSVPAADAVKKPLLAVAREALVAFAAMRATEGTALRADLLTRLAAMRDLVAQITVRSPEVTPSYREALLKRLRDAGLELELNDERVLREIALFADRCDIAEELTRLGSHFDQCADVFSTEGEIGRKAEFLLQEIGREINTIGAKANDLTITQAVMALKNELERVREQVANVE